MSRRRPHGIVPPLSAMPCRNVVAPAANLDVIRASAGYTDSRIER